MSGYVPQDDDDEEEVESPYENGHWEWDERNGGLVFIKNLSAEDVLQTVPLPKLAGPIEFKDDMDVMEQQRFKRRYQRKTGSNSDIVTLQDVKDVVLFTPPLSILSVSVINMLHLPMTERFLRALILFCQYYLQISDEMSYRALDQLVKIRTPESHKTEATFKENLDDLRLLVAKEYCSMITGDESYRKYHHMGSEKKLGSLSKKDAVLFETVLRIAIQIVWVAVGRKYLNKIEVEVHRLFKSPIFNVVEHKLHTGFDCDMTREERTVLMGRCVRNDMKLNTRSPLMNEVTCDRDMDFRLLGLGVIKFPRLSHRLLFLERVLLAPEETFPKLSITLGIIGMPKTMFDIMLRGLPQGGRGSTSKGSLRSSMSRNLSISKSSRSRDQKSSTRMRNIYPDLVIPEKSSTVESWPAEFPSKSAKKRHCDEVQRWRWLHRLKPTFSKSAIHVRTLANEDSQHMGLRSKSHLHASRSRVHIP